VIDFGFSTLAANGRKIFMPKSALWCAPEHHFNGFTLLEAKSMDIYALGRICMWILLMQSEHYPTDAAILRLKMSDELRFIAARLISQSELEASQKNQLELFFDLTIALDQERRLCNIRELLAVLGSDRYLSYPPISELYRE
jgi:serine/threonine protein kinase